MNTPLASISSEAVLRIRSQSLRSKSLIANAVGRISLAIGEPDFDTPQVIIDAQLRAISAGYTHYSPQDGRSELVDAILKTTAAGKPFSSENVLITHGGAAGITASILGLLNPGDIVLLENPTYSLYLDAINMAGATVKRFSRDENGFLDFDQIDKDAKGAKLIVLCHPSNPTGAIISRDEWSSFGDIVKRNNLFLLCDEAYEGLTYDGANFVSALDIADLDGHLVVCRTFSKKYAMTGWRLGYLIGEPKWIASASTIHRTFNGAVNTANQIAGACALQNAGEDAEKMRLVFQSRRDLMQECLRQIPSIRFQRPHGAFYFWLHYPEKLGPSSEVAARAAQAGVLVRQGMEFGSSGKYALRLSYATDEASIKEGVARLERVLT